MSRKRSSGPSVQPLTSAFPDGPTSRAGYFGDDESLGGDDWLGTGNVTQRFGRDTGFIDTGIGISFSELDEI